MDLEEEVKTAPYLLDWGKEAPVLCLYFPLSSTRPEYALEETQQPLFLAVYPPSMD